ncbi:MULTISPECIES: MFS transporter [unclassified Arthrobacter]|uniref:MFS transporter n=1 Tax=unclassified Arthrobacter TaxID=235627 RepID=UPI001E483902|nr:MULTISPECIES: MFS transporter [unclassified Arthrobacter]MCC9144659.1 MFS transporter [Arthrobacter sp. zg-Y919]MDK1275885.1 MFS transporter [Arthrobacter sp. zg.Y919]WIB02757.1 MFS transporter [Arthrobacter sp. zg-Y919]
MGLSTEKTSPAAPSGSTPAPARWKQVAAWASWDWGSAAFNAVMTTFVFTVYLTSSSFGDTDTNSAVLGAALAIAGVAIAVLAPVTGQRSDAGGRRRKWLTINTLLTCALVAACWFVLPSPDYLILGVALIAAANLFFEFAGVNYNAMLGQVSTPATVGRISGLGWAMGYVGGIAALALVLVGFVQPDVGWFGVTTEDGLNLRAVALFSAVWFLLFALPLMFAVPEVQRQEAVARLGILASYKLLFHRIKVLFRTDRHTIYFLLASAVFRDGLAAVFTFGGVIAAGTFGWELSQVIMFAIFGNVVAAVGSVIGGFLDDRFGPKAVIVGSLIGLIIAGTAVVVLGPGDQDLLGLQWTGDTTFWIFGLMLCLFVGPAQSASRAFLARLAPEGKEGELFGLYATTGRAVSFLAPTLFSACIVIFGAQRYGIIGIVAVLLLGLLVLLPVRSPAARTASPVEKA